MNNWSLSILPSPILELQHAPLPFYSVASQGACPNSLFFHCFQFGAHIWVSQGVGSTSHYLYAFICMSKIKEKIKRLLDSKTLCECFFGLAKPFQNYYQVRVLYNSNTSRTIIKFIAFIKVKKYISFYVTKSSMLETWDFVATWRCYQFFKILVNFLIYLKNLEIISKAG